MIPTAARRPTRRSVVARVALGSWGLVTLLYLATLVLTVGRSWADPHAPLWSTGSFAYAAIGGLICVRRPGNRIGALLLITGGLLTLQAFTVAYFTAVEAAGLAWPGAEPAAWLSLWIEVPGIVALFVFLPLLFPTGRLLSPRWRPVAWAGVALAIVASAAMAVDPDPLVEMPFDNPFAVPALGAFSAFMRDTGFVFAPLLALAAMGSLVLRLKRSTGVERQQMKWFSYSFIVAMSYFFVVWGVFGAVLGLVTFQSVFVLSGVGFTLLIPASMAVAVLRYRLYEIDRLVSRTVSYALLTTVLVGVYTLGVVGLGALVRALTGVESSDLVVAASTLAVAALFGPLRRRIQAAVDRRFNRERYDAQRTIEAFAQRLREEVDLDALTVEMERVATETMRPRGVRVWLRTGRSAP